MSQETLVRCSSNSDTFLGLSGRRSHSQELLTPAVEATLVNWIIVKEASGVACNMKDVLVEALSLSGKSRAGSGFMPMRRHRGKLE